MENTKQAEINGTKANSDKRAETLKVKWVFFLHLNVKQNKLKML